MGHELDQCVALLSGEYAETREKSGSESPAAVARMFVFMHLMYHGRLLARGEALEARGDAIVSGFSTRADIQRFLEVATTFA